MKQFYIIANKQKDKNLELSKKIYHHLKERGAVCHIFDQYEKHLTTDIPIPEGTECILVLGGDGTILNAAGKLIGCNIPLLGINLGTLGFLADINHSEIVTVLDCLIRDDYQIENRIMIRARILRQGKCMKEYTALNDFVIRSQSVSGMLRLTIRINGVEIQGYRADGVIVATPTGSTGYNLSAGGPIINPTCSNYVVTPVCPHSLTGRSVILSKEDSIVIELEAIRGEEEEESIILSDGKTGILLYPGDQIEICKAKEVTPFIKLKEISFVKILKEKLY